MVSDQKSRKLKPLAHDASKGGTLSGSGGGLLMFAEPVIRFVFLRHYTEVPYFRIFALILLLSGFSPEILFRVFARTGRLLRLQCVAALYTILAVVGSAYFLGPLSALFTKLLCDVCTQLLYSRDAAHLLQLKASEYVPWSQIQLHRAGELSRRWPWLVVAPLQLGVLAAAVGGSLYTFRRLSHPDGLVMEDEVAYLKEKARRLLRFAPAS
ncbi:MAG: hypothetical protein R3B54_06845 [Bdellovibrionota bacterium]